MAFDKRRFHRWPCSIACRCRTETRELVAEIKDFSYDGAAVRTEERLPPEGAEVELVVPVEVTLKARVVYIDPDEKPAEYGLQFYGTVDQRREQLLPIYKLYIDKSRPGE